MATRCSVQTASNQTCQPLTVFPRRRHERPSIGASRDPPPRCGRTCIPKLESTGTRASVRTPVNPGTDLSFGCEQVACHPRSLMHAACRLSFTGSLSSSGVCNRFLAQQAPDEGRSLSPEVPPATFEAHNLLWIFEIPWHGEHRLCLSMDSRGFGTPSREQKRRRNILLCSRDKEAVIHKM